MESDLHSPISGIGEDFTETAVMKRILKTLDSKTHLFWFGTIAHLSPLIFAALVLCGCHQTKSFEPENGQPPVLEKMETRNNAASLLYELLGNEKNVSKILIVKSNSVELGRLIKAISEKSAEYHKQLDLLASSDLNLKLHATELPPGEKATRAAVAKTREHELFFSSGKEFEFNLLMTQAEALSYGSHLANIAAENSSLPQEVKTFKMMSEAMKNIYDQVVGQMHRDN